MAGALGRDVALLEEYEAGRIRVSPPDLTEIASVFGIPVVWFFVGSTEPDAKGTAGSNHRASVLSAAEKNAVDEHLALFADELSRIQDPTVRIMLVDMARNLARHFGRNGEAGKPIAVSGT